VEETLRQLLDALRDKVDNLVLLEEMDSTHALALRLIQQMDDEGFHLGPTLILALRQSSGQGRGNRSWSSPPGGLYLSCVRSGLDAGTVGRLPVTAAAAACSALVGLGLDSVGIKWPNDLVAGAGKLGGVLVHARRGQPEWATVSLGINLTATPTLEGSAQRPATSLADHLPTSDFTTWLTEIAVSFVGGLSEALEDPGPALRVWKERLIHAPGDALRVRLGAGSEVTGEFDGVTDEGFLRLACADGERIISSGDILE